MKKDFLICIDSDGCVFDTMEVKHKECFCPAYINFFGLQAVSKYARDAWDFANLYSKWRGIHRLLALLKALEVLSDREEVLERGFDTPRLPQLRKYIEEGNTLTNDGLEAYLETHPEANEIRNILAWSHDVNRRVAELVRGVPPFPHVRENLKKLAECADIVIVSATPTEALKREWEEHGLLSLLADVKGQENGTKKQIIAALSKDYAPGHVLMLGDAPGDLEAAHTNGAQFYPICPDREAQSWAEFGKVAEAFLAGSYAGEKEAGYITTFEALLPSQPNWRRRT